MVHNHRGYVHVRRFRSDFWNNERVKPHVGRANRVFRFIKYPDCKQGGIGGNVFQQMDHKGCEDWVSLRSGEHTVRWKILQNFTGYMVEDNPNKDRHGEIVTVSAVVKLLSPPPDESNDLEAWMEGPESTVVRWGLIDDVWREEHYRLPMLRYLWAHNVSPDLYRDSYETIVEEELPDVKALSWRKNQEV